MKAKPFLRLLTLCFCLCCSLAATAATTNPEAVAALLNRIGGDGTADRFVTLVDETLLTADGKEVFVITNQDGKPCVKGSSVLAVTTGINWYLNHYAHVNLAWNNLTTDLSAVALPVPATDAETRTCSADYRYYLNYCTFSYSMSVWTWERWQQEIDWMALHGINMPLQIVGLDVVWKNLLTKDLGYSDADADAFIAGPCFQGWFGMNNLEGWGGPNPDWWYTRQEELAKKILARERELGMQPVLPGYAGMVPHDIGDHGYTGIDQGLWNGFQRPYILDPASEAFDEISALYYARLEELMGTSAYYSMDPFHEGANTTGIDVAAAYRKIAEAMTAARADAKWVIQYWQWSSAQYNVLSNVDTGTLIVLDLFSDAHTHFGEYQGHDAVYCSLPNFGGRTGLFGRLSKVITDYFAQKANYANIKGIGATPEAIEQVPVLYDALYELPWYTSAPDPQQWLADYTVSRYGTDNDNAKAAWEKVRNSALNCASTLQGPHEAVLCARPALTVNAVSSWGGTEIFYDPQDVADAAYNLLQAKGTLSGANYDYDLTDFTRQALTDYAYHLLKSIQSAVSNNDQTAYATRRDAYLNLILDLDELLCTNEHFMLGRWTTMARGIADETSGTTATDREWLELDNARTLITTWGERTQSESGGLRDYSYREWGGMMKDFYYERWKAFFDNRDNGTALPDWYTNDHDWAHNAELSYSDTPVGSTEDVAAALFSKYFIPATTADGNRYYIYRYMQTDARETLSAEAYRGEAFSLTFIDEAFAATASVSIDLDNDGVYATDETFAAGTAIAIPADAVTGKVKARVSWIDGTETDFSLILRDNVTTPRAVTVATADAAQGSVAIEGTSELSVTTTDDVTIKATAASGYDFLNWTLNGTAVSTDNPYTYYGKDAATFTAHFIVNKWGSPTEDTSELSTISEYGQYLKSLTVAQNGGDEASVYSVEACPSTLFQTTGIVNAPQGSQITLHWTDAGGMNYCRLSAYGDFNCDGDFDDEGELIAVVGDKSTSGNSQLNDYTLQVLLPYEVPLGLTHVRLRFDSSWASGWDGTTDAMPAKSGTTRMVYDIPVNVTAQAATACTISVTCNDGTRGTVDANGQPETYTYGVGDEIVLRAYPAEGYEVESWTDQYGRVVPDSWRDGNFLRFRAPESGTYTANFNVALTDLVVLGDWSFEYSLDGDDITLTKAVSGQGTLTVPSTYLNRHIVGIAAGALQGQTALTSLSLPGSVVSLVASNVLLQTSFAGAGVQDATIPLPQALEDDQAWNLHIDVTNGGSSFNSWGSGLLATGASSLADGYDNGFQLYLAAAGSINLKMGWNSVKTFTVSQGVGSFEVDIDHTADHSITFTVTSTAGTETYTATGYTLSPITTFSTSLAAGTDLDRFTLVDPAAAEAPFRGCTSLAELTVDASNPTYCAIDNVLYSADRTTLLACPEGRLDHTLNLPATLAVINDEAFTAAPELDRIVPQTEMPATAIDGAFETKDIHVQVAPALASAYRAAWGLPIVANVEAGATLTDEETALLTEADAINLNLTAEGCGSTASAVTGIPVWLTATLSSERFVPLCFPAVPARLSVDGLSVSSTPPEALKTYVYQDGSFLASSASSAGACLVSVPAEWDGRAVTLRFPQTASSVTTAPGFGGNGTTAFAQVTERAYSYNAASNLFSLNDEGTSVTLAPFEALLIAGDNPAATIQGPVSTGIGQVAVSGAKAPRDVYDLHGRRILTDAPKRLQPGVYVVDGKKTIIKN